MTINSMNLYTYVYIIHYYILLVHNILTHLLSLLKAGAQRNLSDDQGKQGECHSPLRLSADKNAR
jgi:hypothetical protein